MPSEITNPNMPMFYSRYARARPEQLGESESTRNRRKKLFEKVLIRFEGMRDLVIPSICDDILAGRRDPNEPLPLSARRRPGRPRKETWRRPAGAP
jgi:hypothetical protein